MKDLNYHVKVELINKNMSQKELAKIIGCHPQQLNNVLNGHRSDKRIVDKLYEWLKEGWVK